MRFCFKTVFLIFILVIRPTNRNEAVMIGVPHSTEACRAARILETAAHHKGIYAWRPCFACYLVAG
jgi:hypothetical protein